MEAIPGFSVLGTRNETVFACTILWQKTSNDHPINPMWIEVIWCSESPFFQGGKTRES
jgi:hypothetical protein